MPKATAPNADAIECGRSGSSAGGRMSGAAAETRSQNVRSRLGAARAVPAMSAAPICPMHR
jgi:hypothetical protein